jgi:hypothetical protein
MSELENISKYGMVTIAPAGSVAAGSFGTWTITLTVGLHGIDDRGRILIARRMTDNWGMPQFDQPHAPGYTTVETSGKATLRASWDSRAYIRQWRAAIVVDVSDGALAPGDTVTVTLGDRRGGSQGIQVQTFREEHCRFRVLVDAFGTGQYVETGGAPELRVIGGPAARLVARAPSEIVAGEAFPVTVVAEDQYGNPADGYEATVQLTCEEAGVSAPAAHRFTLSERGAHRFDGLIVGQPGMYRIVAGEVDGALQAVSNSITCYADAPAQRLYWGDIHGQTETSVGTGTVEEYLAFGRDVAALDFVSHCANDFQITKAHWQETKDEIRRFHEPGRYVTFLAYEWSGNTPAGGDHNVYYLGDDGPLHRSSHWQLADKSDEADDRYPISALHETLRGRDDVMIIPHIGGRHANLDFFDAAHTPFIEIASVHGVFEWFAEEALRRGLRVGFVADSDDHTGRPGATYPSGSDVHFGMPGGLLAAYAEGLTRESLWEAFWARRVYGTTGERIVVRVHADGHPMGAEYATRRPPTIDVDVIGTAPLESVELLRGLDVVYAHPLAQTSAGESPLLKLAWEGARVRWRSRPVRWDGSLTLDGGRILSAEPFAIDDPADGIIGQSDSIIRWRSTTSGDPDGLFLDLDVAADTELRFDSSPASFNFRLADLASGPMVVDAGGEGMRVTAALVPRGPRPLSARFTYRDAQPLPGVNAYWLRVVQRNGGMAWSSPIYVDFSG